MKGVYKTRGVSQFWLLTINGRGSEEVGGAR